jgi:hypothetical protein
MADLVGIVPCGVYTGRFLACEVKRPGGKPTAAQRAFLDTVKDAGGVGVVVDDVAQLAALLDEMGV